MIEVTKYKLCCDVEHCDKQLEGTPSQIASSGWGVQMYYQGIRQFHQFEAKDYIHSFKLLRVVCSSCKAQGFDKTMTKE